MKLLTKILIILFFASYSSAENRLEQMISPISNPVNFEDPRSHTEIRPIFLHHELGEDFVTQGGDVQIYALQFRFAVNENLSIIATKDGLIDFNPEALEDETGIADLAGGIKYVFDKDEEAGSIFSGAFRVQAPIGDDEVFQGEGNGTIQISFSGAEALNDKFNLTYGSGIRIPFESDDSTFLDFDIQLDRRVPTAIGDVHPAIAINVVNVLDAGNRLPIDDEGFDFFNFGAQDSEGETMSTISVGARIKFSDDINVGAAYQVPLNNDGSNDLTDYRVTADAIFRL